MSLRGLAVAPIGIAIAIAAGSATETLAFLSAPIHQGLNNYREHSSFESTLSSGSALAALVYGTDGSVVGDDVFDNPDDGVSKVADEDGDDNSIILKSLKSTIDNPSVWNKIACAFAPPPHDRLTPEIVRDASPVGFSDNSIDIALAVPASTEGGASNAAANQLVRVLVTVSFPQAWAFEKEASDDTKLSALLDQVKVLEGLAQDRLSEQRSSDILKDDPGYYEKQIIEQRWRKRLEEESDDDDDELPEWWASIAPPFASLEVREEAALLKKLLNEDEFEDELRALFIEHSKSTKSLVFRASVASVGASGLFLKARVAATIEESKLKSDDDKEAEILATISIPYCNPPKEVTTAEELRDGVLFLVESVDPVPMPVIPQGKEISTERAKDSITPFNEQVVEMVAELENEAENLREAEDEDSRTPLQMSEEASESDEDPSMKATDVDAPSSSNVESEPEDKDGDETIITKDSPKSDAELSRQQPRPPEEEARLAAKYAAIEDLGERAFAILVDLDMVQVTGSR